VSKQGNWEERIELAVLLILLVIVWLVVEMVPAILYVFNVEGFADNMGRGVFVMLYANYLIGLTTILMLSFSILAGDVEDAE